MHAKQGDWLVVEGRSIGDMVRRGRIDEVHGPDGTPPFLVHWSDTGHRTLIFPGSDSYVLSADELRAQEEVAMERFSSIQHTPTAHSTDDTGRS
ncbi:DUF1918 domain-containing protein [Nocardia pseudobrasiliensis]|uniref:Uncharacterized protein DUF1918 n=1 Tax=Nocardia pseudobrasiliensis TaxID=45979 RepID=A0A370HPH1_9NOCA|nr:DUF1918 domain-containing protein [Nocardia pseudobrasiliensis]RDI60476.1 uncharacterized protein DUF1918 [Nocardia pseudobrasiliensis]